MDSLEINASIDALSDCMDLFYFHFSDLLVFWKMADLVPPKKYFPADELDPSVLKLDTKVCCNCAREIN
jgi:hypothetical protein